MQLRGLAAAVIFTGSYFPLSLILLGQDFQPEYLERSLCSDWQNFLVSCELPFRNPVMGLSLFAICFLCLIVTVGTLQSLPPKHEITITETKHIPSDLMNYVLPYVVSFMSLNYEDQGKFLGFLIFMAWLFWLTYKSGRIVLNPVLIALGWKYYEVKYSYATSSNIRTGFALSRTDLVPKKTYRQNPVQDVLIIKAEGGADASAGRPKKL